MSTLKETVATYADGDVVHQIAIDVDDSGAFVVLDESSAGAILVERLAGIDDDFDNAYALATDYQAEKERYLAGERTGYPNEDPLPKAKIIGGTKPADDELAARRAAHEVPDTLAA